MTVTCAPAFLLVFTILHSSILTYSEELEVTSTCKVDDNSLTKFIASEFAAWKKATPQPGDLFVSCKQRAENAYNCTEIG